MVELHTVGRSDEGGGHDGLELVVLPNLQAVLLRILVVAHGNGASETENSCHIDGYEKDAVIIVGGADVSVAGAKDAGVDGFHFFFVVHNDSFLSRVH